MLVLEALDLAYREGGAASLTMAAVARRAGMSKRTLYEIFADRGALFAAYFDKVGCQFIRDLPPEAVRLPFAERMTLILEPREECPTALPLEIFRCIIAEAPARPEMAREFMQKLRQRAMGIVQTEMDRAIRDGEIRQVDTGLAAAILLDMIHQNLVVQLMEPGAEQSLEDRRRRFHAALDIALGGLGRTGARRRQADAVS
ncbi:TetR/AcrR family transcriptional regulator [Mangrovicoccus algicola]|uniref:TetR/AcrR family transcriptional regulator n=1 Tax=Mangrovicoccus algicola TaxID=2771008 RepID=A0A8J7CXK2_9RHOB|nr:TetR/AcrR family transcriptional regulator [Mangrovicoccus algicola]MBE3639027.1 TetR/AcrR family transcriptional regulator [Mangrovicoccus algicola]